MSEPVGRTASLSSVSSVSSISLMEVKVETKLVIQAFLRRTLATPPNDRPGTVGGAFIDHYKYSATPRPKPKDGGNSEAEDVTSADEKRHRFKNLIKLHHLNSTRRPSFLDRANIEEANQSTTSSEEDESENKQQKKLNRKKIRRKLSMFFKLKKEKEKDSNGHRAPQRPSTLAIDVKERRPESPVVSPNHPPEFYDGVAEKLEQIGQRSTSIQSPMTPSSPTACEKDLMVQQLAQVLSLEGDAMNIKINSDPFLRSSLARLSFSSYTKLLDIFGGSQVAAAPAMKPPASPTLQRVAVTMEVSRRIVKAAGPQHMQGFVESYMEKFAPWVKSQGGWKNVVHLEEPEEYD